MCLLLLKPKGKTVSTEEMKKAWDRNGDGASLMYRQNEIIDNKLVKNKWRLQKGILEWKEFEKQKALWEDPAVELVAHLRWASQGTGKGKALCHGFDFYNKDLHDEGHRYLFHNGNFRFLQPNMASSDTEICANLILKEMTNEEAEKFLLEMAKKNYGKFVIYKSNGPIVIDDNRGIWEEGVYFSNLEHRKEKIISNVIHYHGMGYGEIEMWSKD